MSIAAVEVPASHPPPATESAERELAQLAASVGPLRRVLAAIAARLVATKAWQRLCYARLSDYARERPGISARQLQELARVHRVLAGLPALERALLANALPWSKVRLVARVATPDDEQAWIARARGQPTRRLEQEVRALARGPEPEAEAPDDDGDATDTTRVALRCTPAVREKWSLVREVAERVASERLRAEEAFEWVVAEAASSRAVDASRVEVWDVPARRLPDVGAEVRERALRPADRAGPRALPPWLAALAVGLESADAFELDRRLRLAVRFEQTLDAAIAPLLRRVSAVEFEWRSDYWKLAAYAREQLGMSASKARSLLRLERAGDVCPQLRRAWRSGRLSWVKARILAPLFLLDLEGEWRPRWVAWAERVTARRLERDVERALLLRAGHDRAWQRCKFDPARAQDPIPPEERQMCAHDIDVDATEELVFRLPREVAALFFALRQPFEALLDHALETWLLRDPAQRRPNPVIERDGYRCAVPGCTSRRNLHDHHIDFRSAGGSNASENRVTLCAFHHLRCLHAGLLNVHGRAPDALVFELPLTRYRSGDIILGGRKPQRPQWRVRSQMTPSVRVPQSGERRKSPMKRLLIALAALAAFVSFSGVAVVAHAEGPVKCQVVKAGKKTVEHMATAEDCTKAGGKVLKEKAKKK
jgi:hypothetical protein